MKHSVRTFRKKPVTVQAVLWDGTEESMEALLALCEGAGDGTSIVFSPLALKNREAVIHTLEGTLELARGDYVIRGVEGELYPCKPGIFEKTYEEAAQSAVRGEQLGSGT